jgi:hypothetical protein
MELSSQSCLSQNLVASSPPGGSIRKAVVHTTLCRGRVDIHAYIPQVAGRFPHLPRFDEAVFGPLNPTPGCIGISLLEVLFTGKNGRDPLPPQLLNCRSDVITILMRVSSSNHFMTFWGVSDLTTAGYPPYLVFSAQVQMLEEVYDFFPDSVIRGA